MSTQQDIYVAGSKNRPPMLNKENYVPWSSRLLRYAKSRPNGKELTEAEIKQMEVDDQAIQTIFLGLPEDIYATVNSCETAQEICNLKFPNNLQLEWSQHVTIVHQTKDLHIADYTQLYDFLKYNQKEGNQFRQYAGQNVGNQVVQNAVQNPSVQTVVNQNGVIVVPGIANQNRNSNVVAARAEGNANVNNGNQIRCYSCRGLGYLARNCTVRPRRRDAAYLQTQSLIAQKEEAGIQLQAEEFDLIAAAVDLDEIKEVNVNCILMANLQQASTSGTQSDKAPVYGLDGSAKAQLHDNCYDNEIFYILEQGGGILEQHHANVEETRVLYDSLYNNLAIEVEKVNSVNCKLRETNANLTTELGRYKNQEKYFEICQEKYDKLERCYQQSAYQEQCLTKKINTLHLSSGKQITALNKEISNLNKQLSMEKSIVSSL
ncbi:hypothetical protein Tco_1106007 [Tanacetum coccineum]